MKKLPEGPTEEQQKQSAIIVVVEVEGEDGEIATSRLTIADGHKRNALIVHTISKRILDGDIKPGFQTAGLAYGSALLQGIAGPEILDL